MNYFVFVSFFSAFLIFFVEPFIVKYALPFYGSSSSTWTVAVLFFQLLLFLGYLYAYKVLTFSTRLQKQIHVTFIVSAIIIQYFISRTWMSPVLPSSQLSFVANTIPEWSLTIFLFMGVGLFFFVLSTTNTLLQGWYSRSTNKEPYWLYRVSNAGSLIGLFAYPFFIEPFVPIHLQGDIWFAGFLIYALYILYIVLHIKEIKIDSKILEKETFTMSQKIRWIFYSAIPSFMMLSFTNHITQGISPIPFLWVLPLSLYLLSFVLGFQKRILFLNVLTYLLYVGSLFTIIIRIFSLQGISVTIVELISLLLIFFVTSLICHHFLYQSKPSGNNVGFFYIMVSFGGLVGSFLVALVAPLIFTRFWEVDISLVIPLLLFFIFLKNKLSTPIGKQVPGITQGVPYFIVALSFLYMLVSIQLHSQKRVIYENRNFYGIISVTEDSEKRYLNNGSILHGSQYKDESNSKIPTSYYVQKSGVDAAFTLMRQRKDTLHVGLVGLGVGTISSYCKSGDTFTYYEINPGVIEVARNYFSYLTMCPQTKIVEGDARLSLENEKDENPYDILVIDAFSDDAIPTHLLTKEAFHTYVSKIDQAGIITIHISNRNVDLAKPIKRMAEELHLPMEIVYQKERDPNQIDSSPSIWVLLSKDASLLELTDDRFNVIDTESIPSGDLWTDDYSSIIRSLKFKQPSYLE